jgi:hypothetical protein
MPALSCRPNLLLTVSLCAAGALATSCGQVPDSTDDVTQEATAGGSALLVVGNLKLSAPDASTKNRLQALGLTVVVRVASSTTAADASGKALVLVSDSVTSSLGTKLRGVGTGVLCLQPALFDDFGMTTAQGTLAAQTQVEITAEALLRGVRLTVTSSGRIFGWGTPAAAAKKVATIKGDPAKATIFRYDSGAQMASIVAPGRRVGWFGTQDALGALDGAGWSLFDAAVQWAAQGPSACGNAGQMCCAGNSCQNGLGCVGGACQPCGGMGQTCCGGSTCQSGLACSAGTCAPDMACGNAGQMCCAGNSCHNGLGCVGGACQPCGGMGQTCCTAGATCVSTLVCNDGRCTPPPPLTP